MKKATNNHTTRRSLRESETVNCYKTHKHTHKMIPGYSFLRALSHSLLLCPGQLIVTKSRRCYVCVLSNMFTKKSSNMISSVLMSQRCCIKRVSGCVFVVIQFIFIYMYVYITIYNITYPYFFLNLCLYSVIAYQHFLLLLFFLSFRTPQWVQRFIADFS
jgi:hypothetical protein